MKSSAMKRMNFAHEDDDCGGGAPSSSWWWLGSSCEVPFSFLAMKQAMATIATASGVLYMAPLILLFLSFAGMWSAIRSISASCLAVTYCAVAVGWLVYPLCSLCIEDRPKNGRMNARFRVA